MNHTSDTTCDFFLPGPNDNEVYVAIRDWDEPEYAEHRDRISAMWATYRPNADRNFVTEAARDFPTRFWEMYLYCALKDAGLETQSRSGGGPDVLLFDGAGRRTWVEATAAKPGKGANEVVQPPDRTVVLVPDKAVLLRYRSCIEDKAKKGLSYARNGTIGVGEPYVIGLNGAQVPFAYMDVEAPAWARLPRVVQGVFGFGHLRTEFLPNGEPGRSEFSRRTTIQKPNGSLVSTDIFLSPDYSHVSATLFSLVHERHYTKRMGDDFLLVHNPTAAAPLPLGWLQRGVEYWVDGTRLRWTDHRPEAGD